MAERCAKRVVITGAARGLGFASAVRLYREGWRVVAADADTRPRACRCCARRPGRATTTTG